MGGSAYDTVTDVAANLRELARRCGGCHALQEA